MNLEIEVPGLRIKLEYTDKKHVDRTVLAVMQYVQGKSFNDVYDVAQTYVEKTTPNTPKKFVAEVNGIKHYPSGEKGYKCSYSCTCGNKGIRYVKEDANETECHKCKTKLTLMPAHENEAHDDDYNYFLAL